jgi:hypothetical protein
MGLAKVSGLSSGSSYGRPAPSGQSSGRSSATPLVARLAAASQRMHIDFERELRQSEHGVELAAQPRHEFGVVCLV